MIQIVAQALLFLFAFIGAISASIRIIEWGRSRGLENEVDSQDIDKRSREEERDEIIRDILRTLLNEIKYNHEILERGFQKRTKYFFLAFWNYLRTNAFVSVVSSEQYILISSEAQNRISEYYDLVKRLNELAKRLEGEEKALTIQAISGQQTNIWNTLWPLSQELISYLDEE